MPHPSQLFVWQTVYAHLNTARHSSIHFHPELCAVEEHAVKQQQHFKMA